MKFTIVTLLAAASMASAAALPYLPRAATPGYKPFYPRQASMSINSTLAAINTNLKALTATTTAYTGGLIAAAGIASKQSTLDTSIKTATTAVQAMTKLSPADSQALIGTVGTLTPNIQATVKALTDKKQQFSAAGLTGTVSTDIKNLQTDTDALGKALVGIASDDSKTQATQSLTTIDESFKQATAAFAA